MLNNRLQCGMWYLYIPTISQLKAGKLVEKINLVKLAFSYKN